MKKSFLVSVLVLASFSYANACQEEAQIIAQVADVVKVSATSCLANVDAGNVYVFNSSKVCALSFSDIGSGIEVGVNAKGECALTSGDLLSGVVVKTDSGTVILD